MSSTALTIRGCRSGPLRPLLAADDDDGDGLLHLLRGDR